MTTRHRQAWWYAALIAATLGIALAEGLGSYWTGSQALFAEMFHELGDSVPFGIGLIALRLGHGHRFERTGTRINALVLGTISILMFFSGAERLFQPSPILGLETSFIAAFGIAGNALQLLFLRNLKHSHSHGGVHRSQFWHVMSDLISTIIAFADGLLAYFGWQAADGAATMLIGLFIAHICWDLWKEAGHAHAH